MSCLIPVLAALAITASDHVPCKKFIELGWDIPTTAFLREHWQSMERETPFDGLMFRIEAQDDRGRKLSTQRAWNAQPWQRAWLEPALADLKACAFEKFTDNFVRLNATPGDLDWADDAGWAALSDKAGHLAWLVRQAGCKGLAIDFESYGASQFKYQPAGGRSFAATAALARRRGAEFVGAVAREFPAAVLLSLWMNSINRRAGASDDPESILSGEGYGLLPAFVDGMLDAAPPEMTLVDGCESGYYLDSAEEYLRAANAMRSWSGPALRLVSPENRAKYRRQVQAGFGFYLDMFVNPEGHRYYRGPLDGSRLGHLERNLRAARDAADEYVWIYGEQCRWWDVPVHAPKSVGQGRRWEEVLPGVNFALALLRDPKRAARDVLAQQRAEGKLLNLARQPQFAEPASKKEHALPAGWKSWQDERHPTGVCVWDRSVGDGSARARKVAWGCLLQDHEASPGAVYAVEAECRVEGAGHVNLTVRWQTPDHRWTHEADDATFEFRQGDGPWRKAFGVVTVPPGVGYLLILLNVKGQAGDDDTCWFDNVGLYRVK